MKYWFAEYLKLDGVWDSPGGEKKAFYVGDIPTIYWWNKKKLLSFNGPNAVAIKQKLLSTLCDGDITKENIPLVIHLIFRPRRSPLAVATYYQRT